MRGWRTVLVLLLLSACIPRGGEDYRIKSGSDAGPQAPAPSRGPVILIPEAMVVTSTPAWSPAGIDQNAQRVERQSYTVRAGDTLYKIGTDTRVGADAIARANGLMPPYVLQVGQRLQIPAGLYHRISAGETGIAIARAYGVSWSDVVELNNLAEPYVLRAGQFLRLPDGASAIPLEQTPADAQAMADAFTLNIDDIVTGSQPARPEGGKQGKSLATPVSTPDAFAGGFGWPLDGRLIARFGSQGGGKVNDGINIGAASGAPVASAGDGVVVYSGNEISVFGGLVMVDHGGGWITAYGHLGALAVKRGDRVKRGALLGQVGDTGYVDTPQLHFEIRKDRKPVDPLTKLPVR